MDPDYWLGKWRAGDTAFHRTTPHPKLVTFFPKLARAKVMVPLCGKSPDLLWLRAQGHAVVGIELSPIACEAFFKENNLAFAKRAEGSATVYEGEGVQLWCGDFFEVSPAAWAGVTAIYDRAALVALPMEMRKRYAEKTQAELVRGSPGSFEAMLLIVVEYPPLGEERPPHSITDAELSRLFSPPWEIQHLDTEVDAELSGRREVEVREKVYALRWKKR